MTTGEFYFTILMLVLALFALAYLIDRQKEHKAKHDQKPEDQKKIIDWCSCQIRFIDRQRNGIYCKTCKKPIKQ